MGAKQSRQQNSNPNIDYLIDNNLINRRDASQLTLAQQEQINLNFSFPEVKELIEEKHIPTPWYKLTTKQCSNIVLLHMYLLHHKLALDGVLNLSHEECSKLKIAEDYVFAGMTSAQNAIDLSPHQCESLKNDQIKRLILEKKIVRIQDVLSMSEVELSRIRLGFIYQMLELNKITLEQIGTLKPDDLNKLKALQSMICTHQITVEQALEFNYPQCLRLQSPFLVDLIESSIINIDEFNKLTRHERHILESPPIVSLLTTCSHIKLSEVLMLKERNLQALYDENIYHKVATNELNIQFSHIDFLADYIPEPLTVENALSLNEFQIRRFKAIEKSALPSELQKHSNRFFTPINPDPLHAILVKKENRIVRSPPR